MDDQETAQTAQPNEDSSKGKKLPLKRVKKKTELNISKGKLKFKSKKQEFSCKSFNFLKCYLYVGCILV